MIVFLLCALVATVSTFLLEPRNDIYCQISFPMILIPVQLMYAITAGRLWRINAVVSPLLVEQLREKSMWRRRFMTAIECIFDKLLPSCLKPKQKGMKRTVPTWQLSLVVAMLAPPVANSSPSDLNVTTKGTDAAENEDIYFIKFLNH